MLYLYLHDKKVYQRSTVVYACEFMTVRNIKLHRTVLIFSEKDTDSTSSCHVILRGMFMLANEGKTLTTRVAMR